MSTAPRPPVSNSMPKRARSNSAASIEVGIAAAALSPKRVAYSPLPRTPKQRDALRSASPSPLGCTLPLTYAHVSAVPDSTDRFPATSSSWTPSSEPHPTSSPRSKSSSMSSRLGSPTPKNWDDHAKLVAFQIIVDSNEPFPAELQQHIDHVLRKPIAEPRSPNAQKIRELRQTAAMKNEAGANRLLEPWLLFSGELSMAVQDVPKIASELNINLSRDYLPRPPTELVQKMHGGLTRPQPDTATGYLTPTAAIMHNPPLATAFTQEEQTMIASFTLNPILLFPFLTSQWKPATGEPHQTAMCQAARDGATVVNYLHEYYNTCQSWIM